MRNIKCPICGGCIHNVPNSFCTIRKTKEQPRQHDIKKIYGGDKKTIWCRNCFTTFESITTAKDAGNLKE